MSFFKDHWTLSDWLSGSSRRDELITEDAAKRSRLTILRTRAGIPSTTTTHFPYRELVEYGPRISEFAKTRGETPHALRLHPISAGPVLRERGEPVHELITWARDLQLPIDAYECAFEQHLESRSSAIFVCTQNGVWGEYHNGSLLELNRGFVSDSVIRFNSSWEQVSTGLPELVTQAISYLEIFDKNMRQVLRDECGADFAENHLLGYFEAIHDPVGGLWFADYNRLLVAESPLSRDGDALDSPTVLTGQTGSRGKGRGLVIHAPDAGTKHISANSVLVARATRPELIGMMASSRAVITEVGGVLSHAAIACRELGIPCVVGVRGAMSTLVEDVEVMVDADAGTIEIVQL